MERIGKTPLLWLGDRQWCRGAQTHIFAANHLGIVPPQWSAITLLTPCLYKIVRNPSESLPGLLCETGSWCVSAPCNSFCHLHTERPISCFATVALLKNVCESEREHTYSTCMQKLASALIYTLLFEHGISPPVLLVPCAAAYDQSWQACVRSRYRHEIWTGISYKEMTVHLAFLAPHTHCQVQWNAFAQPSLWAYFDCERRNGQQAT